MILRLSQRRMQAILNFLKFDIAEFFKIATTYLFPKSEVRSNKSGGGGRWQFQKKLFLGGRDGKAILQRKRYH